MHLNNRLNIFLIEINIYNLDSYYINKILLLVYSLLHLYFR